MQESDFDKEVKITGGNSATSKLVGVRSEERRVGKEC